MPTPAMVSSGAATLARRPRATSWAISTVALLVYFLATPTRRFGFDALAYYLLRDKFHDWLSFTDFDHVLRGYSFPWTLRVFSDLLKPFTDDPTIIVRAFSLVVVPALLCVLVPTVARRVSSEVTVTIPRILLLNVLFFLAWRNDLLVPLADIPALALMTAGVALVLARRSLPAAAGAGLAFGLALNYRPAYLLAAATGVALLFLVERENRRLLLRTATLVAFVALAVAPQVAINLTHHDTISPVPVSSSALTLLQLKQGLALDRYETYVGDRPGQPAAMRFENRSLATATGTSAVPGSSSEFESISDYLRFVVDHPADVVASYTRHLVNGLDTRFGGSYVRSIDEGNVVVPLANLFVLVVAVAVLCIRWMRREETHWRSPTTWFVAVLVVACLPSIAGAVEARFLLPLHLTLLATFSLGARRADLPTTRRARTAAVAGVVAAVLVLMTLTASTMGSLRPAPLSVDGKVITSPSGEPD